MIGVVLPTVLLFGLPLLLAVSYWRWVAHKDPVYVFSSLLPFRTIRNEESWHTYLLFFLRGMTLFFLLLAIARLRSPDERSRIPVQGIDIMLVLDTSGSMEMVNNPSDEDKRIDSALKEALSFIERRENDPIGLVIFSGAAVTRCPLTLDKKMLEQILKETSTQTIPVEGTVLSDGIIVAANRLKKSPAATRIMIVLTDGMPSPNDSDPATAVELAKKLGIKIYTVGIGTEEGGWFVHPLFGWQRVAGSYNEELLKIIADRTGGKFFQARNKDEMAAIYDTIDTLEKTEHQMPIYSRYFEYFVWLLWAAFILCLIELILSTLLWVRL